MNVGKTIAALRTANGISQQTLAERLSVSRELVSKWENGTRTPDYPTIERIAELFGVPADRILDKNDLVFRELSECVSAGGELPGETLSGIVNGFLRGLREKEADIFLKRYYFLETAAEIAGEYGLGENHVRSILSKTRKKLKKQIGEALK
ncbi:MAG: helix-turn-helix domain-containing protein [Clostridia bacterium]|nr:helix-turn-helix domain-containing protein [Clostridia bacterium]